MLVCKNCGGSRDIGRRLCRSCDLERKKKGERERFAKEGRRKTSFICVACKQLSSGFRKEQKFCTTCWKLSSMLARSLYKKEKAIAYQRSKATYRKIVEQHLGRELTSREVVHHLNGNPLDNRPENLLVLSSAKHKALHLFLNQQRVILAKAGNENWENCWNTLIAPMTTTWLETANVKVIKLGEIGQSAAEPRKAEGSETMHPVPETDNAVGKEIVQPTT